MNPITRRTAIGSETTEWPATRPSPEVGRSSVARNRMVVLLPAPLGPMNPNTSPCPIEKLRSLTATKSPYFLVKLTTSIIAASSPHELSGLGGRAHPPGCHRLRDGGEAGPRTARHAPRGPRAARGPRPPDGDGGRSRRRLGRRLGGLRREVVDRAVGRGGRAVPKVDDE